MQYVSVSERLLERYASVSERLLDARRPLAHARVPHCRPQNGYSYPWKNGWCLQYPNLAGSPIISTVQNTAIRFLREPG